MRPRLPGQPQADDPAVFVQPFTTYETRRLGALDELRDSALSELQTLAELADRGCLGSAGRAFDPSRPPEAVRRTRAPVHPRRGCTPLRWSSSQTCFAIQKRVGVVAAYDAID